MERKAFKMFLKKGCENEYEKRHKEIWPELKQLFQQSGVSDYSIFWDKDTNILFASQKISNCGGSQDLSDRDIVQRWWLYMSDIMETNEDNSPVSVELKELFYLE